jgi:hypothetical protein
MEMHENHTNGIANAGLTTGIIGTSLGVLNGGLGNLFGGLGRAPMSPADVPVSRYEVEQLKTIVDKDAEIAYLKGRDAAKSDSLALYQYVDGRLRGIESQIAAQATINAQITANIACMQGEIATLNGLTKTVIPIGNVCPAPMPQYNSWTAPTATT